MIACYKGRCYSPTACGGFGYCRELNFERDPREAADDARRCYDEAIKAMRERGIRAHTIEPLANNPEEQQWWAEGMRPRT